jgi:hypothetical protein
LRDVAIPQKNSSHDRATGSRRDGLRIADCIPDCVWLALPKPTERQRIGNQIDTAMIFASTDFVKRAQEVVDDMVLTRKPSGNQKRF